MLDSELDFTRDRASSGLQSDVSNQFPPPQQPCQIKPPSEKRKRYEGDSLI